MYLFETLFLPLRVKLVSDYRVRQPAGGAQKTNVAFNPLYKEKKNKFTDLNEKKSHPRMTSKPAK